METRILLLLFLFTLFITNDINAEKFSRGSSSRGSSSRGSSSRGSSSRGSSSRNSSSREIHTTGSRFYGFGSSNGHTAGSSSVSSSGIHMTGSSPYGHETSSSGHTTGSSSGGRGTSLSQTSYQQNKDHSLTFLHAEGGGATQPGTYPGSQIEKGFTTKSKNSASYSPSVPHNPSAPYKPSAPYDPSVPPADRLSKPIAVPMQNHVLTSFGQPNALYNPSHGITSPNNPAWSNPYYNPSQSYPSNSNSNVGFKDYLRPSTSIPVPSASNSRSHYPISGSNSHTPPYPIHSRSNQHHSTFNPSYSAPSQIIGHYSNYPPHIPPTVPNTFGNPYSTFPVGAIYDSARHGYYPQQHVLAQPFIPGQTVIMVPGQQDNGRGLSQIMKEAFVFSTINAGVNRLINPHPHIYDFSRPTSSSDISDTHITYNNNYFNGAPADNNPPVSVSSNAPLTNAPVSYPNYPIPMNNPAIMPNMSVPTIAGNNANITYPGSSVNIAGVTNNMRNPPIVSSNGLSANNVTNNQGMPNQNTTVYNPQYKISNSDLWRLTEELYAKQDINIFKYLTLHLQNKSENVTDAANEPLIYAEREIYDYPTILVIRALYDNYEYNSNVKENRTPDKQRKEDILLDAFLHTNVMTKTMQWLSSQGFINPDDFEWKDILRRIWFTQFDGMTSGFERIFTSERYDMDLLGVQDWIYFNYQESKKRIDYMGYIDTLKLGNKASLLKLNFKMDIIVSNRTIFVGTVPELEMSLYTICFYARPNDLCPVSLGGTKFNIFTHSFRYYGQDLIDLALLIF